MMTIEGQLEHITYHNRENHYTVARLRTGNLGNLVTVIGYLPDPSPGESLRIQGNWETHPRFGPQLKIDSYEIVLPRTADQIGKYLSAGIIEGVGPKTAGRLVAQFGDRTLQIIEESPEVLTVVPGIGKSTVGKIAGSWQTHHLLRGLMHFLQERKIPTAHSAKILKAYGEDAIEVLRSDPYRVARDIPGFTFALADSLARQMGVSEEAPARIHACIHDLMVQNAGDGHMFAPGSRLLKHCQDLLNIGHTPVRTAIGSLVDSGELVREEVSSEMEPDAVFLTDYYLTEKGIADRLNAFLSIPVAQPAIETDQIIAEVLKRLAIEPSSEQLDVLRQVFSHRVAIITGGPGTGKTTLIRSIAAILSFQGKDALLAAPTGRAARRLSVVTQRKASTIHRLLGYNLTDGLFFRGQDNPLETDAVIIDEASMLDAFLTHHLLKAVPVTAMLILVGDVFQLPSVGPGNVLSDMIQSQAVQTFELDTIYRQAQESPIVMNAHKVRMGEEPDLERSIGLYDRSEFSFIEQASPEKAVETIVDLCSEEIPAEFAFDSIADIQVLSPMHKGAVGTINLNQVLQEALNPGQAISALNGGTFRQGDKVMHLKNNYQKDVFNGDIGTVSEIDSAAGRLAVDYDGWFVDYEAQELDELSLAYSITVHKSQGSEYPAVIVPVMTQHYALLQRNLIYTAMTRGRNLVVFIGTRQALGIALRNDRPHRRLSSLADRLMAHEE